MTSYTRCPECKGKGRVDTPPRIQGDWVVCYKDCQHCLGMGRVLSGNIIITATGRATVRRMPSPRPSHATTARRKRWWHMVRRNSSASRGVSREAGYWGMYPPPPKTPFADPGRSSAAVPA